VAAASLQVQATRVCLREIESRQFGLEVAVRFRLLDSQDKHAVWEQILTCSPAADALSLYFGYLPFPYEGLLSMGTPVRPLTAYEGPAGRALVQADLEEAVRGLVAGFLALTRSPSP